MTSSFDLPGIEPLDSKEAARIVGGMSDIGWKMFCGLGHMLGMNDGST